MAALSSIRDIKVTYYPNTSKVYGFGGYINDALSNSLLEYDTRFKSHALISPSGIHFPSVFIVGPGPCARVHHAICIGPSSLFIYGGLDVDNKPLNDLWRFDIKHQTWKQVVILLLHDV